ncbi:MAG: hypothetical protein IPJ43_17470 [Saprospiraceae bacterium]|nr:hypothetical protein [Saprospiraceae bacterium]
MKHTFNIIILMLSTISSYSQKHDYNWHLGYRIYDTAYLPHRGITNINFNTLSLNPSFKYDSFKIIDFDWTCNDMSDEDGNYLFSYNGYTVENYLNQIIQNGKGGFSSQKTSKDVNYQGGLILNLKRLNEFILVHDKHNMELFSPNFQSDGLRYSLINIQHKINEGKVIKKDYKILEDTLDYGRLLSIKHANGRDWWIIRVDTI